MLTIPKPAEIAGFVAACYEDEVPRLVTLRDTLEKNRIIPAADAADRGVGILGEMAGQTRKLQDLIVARWPVLTPRAEVLAEIERVTQGLQQATGDLKLEGNFVVDVGGIVAEFFKKVPLRLGEFPSPEAKSAAAEIDGISRTLHKKRDLYLGTVDIVSKRTEPLLAERRRAVFVLDGLTIPELEEFQRTAKHSATRVDNATKGLEKQVIDVVLPVDRSVFRQ
jgi:hypothetical protein